MPARQYKRNSGAVVLHEQPVADVCAIAVNRRSPAIALTTISTEMGNMDLVELLCDEIDRRFAADKSLSIRFPRCPTANGGSTRARITFVKDRPGHDRRYAICAEKLARELGFAPRPPLVDGLRHTIDWYLANEDWWRAIQTGAYRDWMKLQYGAALTGSDA